MVVVLSKAMPKEIGAGLVRQNKGFAPTWASYAWPQSPAPCPCVGMKDDTALHQSQLWAQTLREGSGQWTSQCCL